MGTVGGTSVSGTRRTTLVGRLARLGFADLLSVGDEPEEILERFPAVTAPPRLEGTPEMLVNRMRNPV